MVVLVYDLIWQNSFYAIIIILIFLFRSALNLFCFRQRQQWQNEQKRIKQGKERLMGAKQFYLDVKENFDQLKQQVDSFKY